ncbi:GspH/FimT family pseudopilin [Pseudomonas sp. CC6-YY-74]|uniref:GspH/FimT family pseudopilin n=1 Tax=Pseudomonas sp. CC6-YY-74 TaxID=1930532 RepID=UPI0009A21F08|nr:GspH/FimT family pseudopilin [Pseudomonas sp. CC6-YY-74]
MSRRTDMLGFTLIELMITIALLAIVIGIAIPNFTGLIRNNQLEAQTQSLNSLLQFARSEAVVRRTSILVTNNNNVWTISLGGQPIRQETFNTAQATITTVPSPVALTYFANGSATALNVMVCRDAKPETAYQITVQPSGSTRINPRGKDADNVALTDCTL